MENVLSPKYMATTPEEIRLFDAQKDYMSAVFDRTLLLVEGKSILGEMGSRPDPQNIFEKLLYPQTPLRRASKQAVSWRLIVKLNMKTDKLPRFSSNMSIIISSNSTR